MTGRRGRPPKPPILHIAEGTHRRDRHGDPAEAVPSFGVPERPKRLTGEARKLWESVVPGLVSSGVATERDTYALAEMCEWYKRYRKAATQADKIAATNPYWADLLRAAKTAWTEFDRVAARFGLTPADRAKLKTETPSKPQVASRKRG